MGSRVSSRFDHPTAAASRVRSQCPNRYGLNFPLGCPSERIGVSPESSGRKNCPNVLQVLLLEFAVLTSYPETFPDGHSISTAAPDQAQMARTPTTSESPLATAASVRLRFRW